LIAVVVQDEAFVIPYVEMPPIEAGPLTLHWPMLFWALGLAVHYGLFLWRLRVLKEADAHLGSELYLTILICSLAGGWAIAWNRTPGSAGLRIVDGVAFGIAGSLAYGWFRGLAIRSYAIYLEAIAAALPAGAILMRLGCAIEHAHAGIHSNGPRWLAVAYPDGARWDLAVLEMVFFLLLAPVMAAGARGPQWRGPFMCLAYGVFRLATTPLRIDTEPALSPAAILIPAGVLLLVPIFYKKDQIA
jgi:prolipoprotein diacylglyceryltransferase